MLSEYLPYRRELFLSVLFSINQSPDISLHGNISRLNAYFVYVQVFALYRQLSKLCEKPYLILVKAVNVRYARKL